MFDAATKDDIREVKDEIRAVGVLVERLDAKVDAVIEGLTSTRDELKRDMASMEDRLLERMRTIEHVVGENSAEIARQSEEIRRLTGDTRSLHQQVLALRVDMTNKLVSKESHAELEARTTALEKKLGITKP
jgi:uncharacterized coiled-coil DUF342 family protein